MSSNSNLIEMYKEDFTNSPTQNILNKIKIIEKFDDNSKISKEGQCNGTVMGGKFTGKDCNYAFQQVKKEQGLKGAKNWCSGTWNQGCTYSDKYNPAMHNDPNKGICVGTVQKPSAFAGKSCDFAYHSITKDKDENTAKNWCSGAWNKGCRYTTAARINAELERQKNAADKNRVFREISDFPMPKGLCSGIVNDNNNKFNNQSCSSVFNKIAKAVPGDPNFGMGGQRGKYPYINAKEWCNRSSGCNFDRNVENVYYPDGSVKDQEEDEELHICKASTAAEVGAGLSTMFIGPGVSTEINEMCNSVPSKYLKTGIISEAIRSCNNKFGCTVDEKALRLYNIKRKNQLNNMTVLQSKTTDELNHIDKLNNKFEASIQDTYRTNIIIDKQNREIDFSQKKLNDIEDDTNTIKRQTEISENETLRKNNLIFKLKIIFIFILLTCIPAYLMKINKLTQIQGSIVIGVISLVLFIILLKNFINNRYNNPNNLNVQLWTKPDIQEVEHKFTGAENDKKKLQDRIKNMSPLDKLEFILSEHKKTAINNENYAEAGHYDSLIKSITNKLATGDTFAGFGSNQGILEFIDKMNSIEEKERIQKQLQLKNNEKIIENNIKKQQTQIKNLQSQQKNNLQNNKQISNAIQKLNNSIVFEENQLNNLDTQNKQLKKPIKKPGFESGQTKRQLDDIKNFKSIGSI